MVELPDSFSPPSTSLDAQETNVGFTLEADRALPPKSKYAKDVAFRHRNWSRHRENILNALRKLPLGAKRSKNFENCGSFAWICVDRANPKRVKIACDRCKDRFCQPCQKERSRRLAKEVEKRVTNKNIRFITLTLKSRTGKLKTQIDQTIKNFRKLRQSKKWKESQRGGAFFLEVTFNSETQKWHPHIHVVSEGRFLAHDELKKCWFRITGNSFIVDIRKIKNPRYAANYVAKYATKELAASVINQPERLEEAIMALHGRRLVSTFGTWRGLSIMGSESETDWEPVGKLSDILKLAELGEQWAKNLIEAVTNGGREISCPEIRLVNSS